MKKPNVGDELILVIYDRWRHNGLTELESVTVTKVGRKYFTISYWNTQFHIDDWAEKTEYASMVALYPTLQDYKDAREHSAWLDAFKKTFDTFSRPNLSLEQYRAAAEILGIELPPFKYTLKARK